MKLIFLLTVCLFTITSNAQRLGEKVPEIKLKSVNGELLSLQSLNGKVVILDFWASWCGPCKSTNKELSKIYKKYKAKGLEIFSVSVDTDSIKWKKAIIDQKLTWMQVIDPGGWTSPTANKWGIEALPTTFLIDKNGVLRYYDLNGKDLIRKIDTLIKE
jgi:peroxiredoxin